MEETNSLKLYIKTDINFFPNGSLVSAAEMDTEKLDECVKALNRQANKDLEGWGSGWLHHVPDSDSLHDEYSSVTPSFSLRGDTIFCELDCMASDPLRQMDIRLVKDDMMELILNLPEDIMAEWWIETPQGRFDAHFFNDDICMLLTSEELEEQYPSAYSPEELAKMLAEKLDQEMDTRKVQQHWNTVDLPRNFSLIARFRATMDQVEISSEFAGVLLDTEDLLAGLVDYITDPKHFTNGEMKDVGTAANEYLTDIWYQYRFGILYDRLVEESEAFRAELLGMTKEEIIELAYKINGYDDILILFDCHPFSLSDIETLLLMENPLAELYEGWRDVDNTYMDDLLAFVEDTISDAQEQAESGKADEQDAGDELEP